MKHIEVVAAVITSGNKVFCTQRGYGDFKDLWEFPGGKMEAGETPEQALVREIKEELDTEISVGDFIETVEHDYPTFHLTMHCFFCKVLKGDLVLLEHEASKWVEKENLDAVDWLPADRGIIEKIKFSLTKPTDLPKDTKKGMCEWLEETQKRVEDYYAGKLILPIFTEKNK